MNIKLLLRHLYTLPWSPRGRKMRIEKLMRDLGEERDICAAIVYTRDATWSIWLSEEEKQDALRIKDRLIRGKITMPADRK